MIIVSHLFDTSEDLERFKADFLTSYPLTVTATFVKPSLEELQALIDNSKEIRTVFLVASTENSIADLLCKHSKTVSKQWLNENGNWRTKVIKYYIF